MNKTIERGCEANLCTEQHHAKGLCKKHWHYLKRYGSLEARNRHTPNEIIIEGDTAFIQCYDVNSRPTERLIIDAVDVHWIKRIKWSLTDGGYGRSTVEGKMSVYLHRILMGCPRQKIDHINRNPLDNRRSNLRVASNSENAQNVSGHKGFYRSRNGGYVARVYKAGRAYTKTVRTEKEALVWRKRLERKYFGDFAPN